MSAVSDADEDAISLSLFRNAFDNEPRRVEVSWEYLVDRLCAPPVVLAKKEYVLSYSPAIFRGERGKETVEQVSFLSFDLDDIPAEAFQDVRRRIAGLAAVVYSTFQHADALTRNEGRYRLVLRLSRAVLASEWELFWYRARARYAPDADEQCTDASRIYFLPCVPSEDAIARHEAFALEGAAIDVDEILREPEPKRREPATDGWSRAIAMMGATQAPNGGERWARTALENEANVLINAEKGTRNSQLNKSAFNLGQIVAGGGLTESEVVYALLGACAQNGLIADDGELSARRTLRSGLEKGQKNPRAPRPKGDERVSGVHVAPKEAEKPAPASTVATPATVLASWLTSGPLLHEPTGLPKLDAATGGGPVYGRLWIIPGAPNAGKTFLLVHIAHEYALRGVLVGLLAVDEEADDVVTRLAQRVGFSRVACETRGLAEVESMTRRIGDLLIRIYDESWTIDGAADDLVQHAKELGRRAMLGVDSLQTVRCTAELATKRELGEHQAIAARVLTLKSKARCGEFVAIATSEMPRTQYRSKSAKADANPLAAGKGSGAIEYGARVQLGMTSLQGEPDVVQLELAKNKQGKDLLADNDEAIYLRIDRAAQRLEETEKPQAQKEQTADESMAEAAKHEKLSNELVLAILKARTPITSRKDLCRLVRGRREDIEAAVSSLLYSGRIKGGRGAPYQVSYNGEENG
jgi:hypothetical protein